MLKDEFDHIMSLFDLCLEGKPVNVEEVFKQALDFFEKITQVLKEGDLAQKKEALGMMGQMYRRMIETSQKLSKETGLNDEQLAKMAENPGNFSGEQWKTMQASKERMAYLTKDLLHTLENINPDAPQIKEAKEGAPKPKSLPKPKKGGKSDWLKS